MNLTPKISFQSSFFFKIHNHIHSFSSFSFSTHGFRRRAHHRRCCVTHCVGIGHRRYDGEENTKRQRFYVFCMFISVLALLHGIDDGRFLHSGLRNNGDGGLFNGSHVLKMRKKKKNECDYGS